VHVQGGGLGECERDEWDTDEPPSHPIGRKKVAKAQLHALDAEAKQIRLARDSGGESVGGDLGVREDATLDAPGQCVG
jgi:hypothetical protein